MKLLIALVVVSSVMLKVQGATVAGYGTSCAVNDNCTLAHSECKEDDNDVTKCLCSTDYVVVSSVCKLEPGQACTDATKADCSTGVCMSDKCQAGATAIVASLALMLTTLVTTRFL